jgi:hypothetical protein
MMHFRTFVFILVALIAVVGIIVGTGVFKTHEQPQATAPEVLSFEDCAAAGYPVMESYPRQCRTPDGRLYVEEIPAPTPTYLNASADLITVTNPTPGSVTGKEFTVMGQARGTWYFEASFPIEVRDTAGNLLASGIGQPLGGADWMTEEFVPFSAEITVPESFIGEAVLILKNDNPSGLPENARSVSFPFTIEY